MPRSSTRWTTSLGSTCASESLRYTCPERTLPSGVACPPRSRKFTYPVRLTGSVVIGPRSSRAPPADRPTQRSQRHRSNPGSLRVRCGREAGSGSVQRSPSRLRSRSPVAVPRSDSPNPATKQSRSMSDLWRGGVMTALVVGAIVLSLIIFTVLRYRRRGRDDVPSQRQYIIPLEIVYTVDPDRDRARAVRLLVGGAERRRRLERQPRRDRSTCRASNGSGSSTTATRT